MTSEQEQDNQPSKLELARMHNICKIVARVIHSYMMDFPYAGTIALGLVTLKHSDGSTNGSPLFVVELIETKNRDIQFYFEELVAINQALSEIGIVIQCITPGKIGVRDDKDTLSINGDKELELEQRNDIDKRRLNLFLHACILE